MLRIAGSGAEIATASTEQRTGIDQVDTAVSRMDRVTQSSAGALREAVAALARLVDDGPVVRRDGRTLMDAEPVAAASGLNGPKHAPAPSAEG